MKSKNKLVHLISLLLLASTAVFAQTNDVKQFNKDGVTFDYPSAWALEDRSDNDAQQLVLGRSDGDAQVRVFVLRPPVSTPEKLAEAKRVLVDPYVNATAKQFEAMGAKPERVAANSEIAATPAEGVKLQAVLDREPGAAEIYWSVVGQRLVVLTFFGPDKARKQSVTGWDSIRNTLKVQEVKPPAPAKKP